MNRQLLLVVTLLVHCPVPGWFQSVQLDQGTLRGVSRTVRGKTVFTFLGVPYAEPPVGERRFKRALPHRGWTGSYFASSFKPACPQPSGIETVRGAMTEDCLFLNIWTPVLPGRPGDLRGTLPVVVFFEGQLFTLGNPEDVPAEDFVSDQDLVFVSVNYRLNVFGFLSFEDEDVPGNFGLSDQLLALEWIQRNIEKFGGSVNAITLMGHSSGAASAMFHLFHSRSNSMIRRAIAMSGSFCAPWAIQPSPRANALRLADELGCLQIDTKDILACLQSKRMIDLVTTVDNMIRDGNISAIFAPVVDNFLVGTSIEHEMMVKDLPVNMMMLGVPRDIPVMTGLVTDEGLLMAYFFKEILDKSTIAETKSILSNLVIPSLLKQASWLPTESRSSLRRAINFEYFVPEAQSDQEKDIIYQQIIDLFNDVYFVSPLEKQLITFAKSGGTSFFYLNSFQSRESEDIFGNTLNSRNSSHGLDLLYLFGPAMYRRFFPADFVSNQVDFPSLYKERLSRTLKAVFGRFIVTGEPIRSLQWERFNGESQRYFDITTNTLNSRYKEKAYRFWYDFLPSLGELTTTLPAVDNSGKSEDNVRGSEDSVTIGEMSPFSCATYITFTWLLLAAVVILILIFLALVWMMRSADKRTPAYEFEPSPSVFSMAGNDDVTFRRSAPQSNLNFQPVSQSGRRSRSRWRDEVIDYRL